VIAVSRAAGEAHISAGMADEQRLTVIANGVDVEEWRADAIGRERLRRGFGLGDKFVWLAAGRLEPVKDYPTLLRAFCKVTGRACLVIAGGGTQRQELEMLVERLGLGRKVRFPGFVPDVKRWMQAADGFVLTSRWEGLPMGILEAGACELPQVATRVSGTCEAMKDGVTGWLANSGDDVELAEAMNLMMATPREERRLMGVRARQRVIERFSLEVALDRHEALYRELLAAKSWRVDGPETTTAVEARLAGGAADGDGASSGA